MRDTGTDQQKQVRGGGDLRGLLGGGRVGDRPEVGWREQGLG